MLSLSLEATVDSGGFEASKTKLTKSVSARNKQQSHKTDPHPSVAVLFLTLSRQFGTNCTLL